MSAAPPPYDGLIVPSGYSHHYHHHHHHHHHNSMSRYANPAPAHHPGSHAIPARLSASMHRQQEKAQQEAVLIKMDKYSKWLDSKEWLWTGPTGSYFKYGW